MAPCRVILGLFTLELNHSPDIRSTRKSARLNLPDAAPKLFRRSGAAPREATITRKGDIGAPSA